MSETDCLFCKIVKGEIPCAKVMETENIFAFKDIKPAADTHILIIPKIHKASLNEFDESNKELLGEILLAAKTIAEKEGLHEDGYRTVVNTGENGGQTVSHLHMHLLGGRRLNWPPG